MMITRFVFWFESSNNFTRFFAPSGDLTFCQILIIAWNIQVNETITRDREKQMRKKLNSNRFVAMTRKIYLHAILLMVQKTSFFLLRYRVQILLWQKEENFSKRFDDMLIMVWICVEFLAINVSIQFHIHSITLSKIEAMCFQD